MKQGLTLTVYTDRDTEKIVWKRSTFVAVFQLWVGSGEGIARILQSQLIPVRFLV